MLRLSSGFVLVISSAVLATSASARSGHATNCGSVTYKGQHWAVSNNGDGGTPCATAQKIVKAVFKTAPAGLKPWTGTVQGFHCVKTAYLVNCVVTGKVMTTIQAIPGS